jgi:hypothetical protein
MSALKKKNIVMIDAAMLTEFREQMRDICEPMSLSTFNSVKDCTAVQTPVPRKK